MAAIDTVLLDLHNATTAAVGLTPSTPATGDSLSIRSFAASDWARIVGVGIHASAGPRRFRLTSPRLHDTATGISFQSAELPSEFLFPPQAEQDCYSSDTLVAQLDAAASSDTVAYLQIYYKNLQGTVQDLRSWADVKPNVIAIKPIEVDVTSAATIGQWSDTLITATENQLKADYAYALLGFQTSAALLAMGLKGPATSSLRVCAPGTSTTLDITSYFIELGARTGLPCIPVFKANDRNSTYISVAAPTASVTADVFAILAQLPS